MRARTIKPGFFTSEQLAACSPLARILFSGLWGIADRGGKLRDRPRKIKAELLPYEAEPDAEEWLCELARVKLILRYEVEGEKYIKILQFEKHQNPHPREPASEIPEPLNFTIEQVNFTAEQGPSKPKKYQNEASRADPDPGSSLSPFQASSHGEPKKNTAIPDRVLAGQSAKKQDAISLQHSSATPPSSEKGAEQGQPLSLAVPTAPPSEFQSRQWPNITAFGEQLAEKMHLTACPFAWPQEGKRTNLETLIIGLGIQKSADIAYEEWVTVAARGEDVGSLGFFIPTLERIFTIRLGQQTFPKPMLTGCDQWDELLAEAQKNGGRELVQKYLRHLSPHLEEGILVLTARDEHLGAFVRDNYLEKIRETARKRYHLEVDVVWSETTASVSTSREATHA